MSAVLLAFDWDAGLASMCPRMCREILDVCLGLDICLTRLYFREGTRQPRAARSQPAPRHLSWCRKKGSLQESCKTTIVVPWTVALRHASSPI